MNDKTDLTAQKQTSGMMSSTPEDGPHGSAPVMTTSEFHQHLIDHKSYHTPDQTIRPPWLPSLVYHKTVLVHVFSAGWNAWRGSFDVNTLAAASATVLLSVEKLGGRIAIDGLESLAALQQPCVVVANHISALETHSLACILLPFQDVTFVVKRSLLSYPGFGSILRRMGAIGITRKNPREDLKILLTDGVQRVKSGKSVILFPQSRRRDVFDPAQFNSIGVKLAARANVPLIPLALKTDFLTRGFPIPDIGRVHPERDVRFSFGPAIQAVKRERDAHREVVAFIHDRLRSWNAPCLAP